MASQDSVDYTAALTHMGSACEKDRGDVQRVADSCRSAYPAAMSSGAQAPFFLASVAAASGRLAQNMSIYWHFARRVVIRADARKASCWGTGTAEGQVYREGPGTPGPLVFRPQD